MEGNRFQKEYKYKITTDDGKTYETVHKIDISRDDRGKYHVTMEYTVSDKGRNIYATAMDFKTPRLIEGKHAPLITEENLFENDFNELVKSNVQPSIGEIIAKIEKGMIKTTGRLCIAEKEKGGMFLREADMNFRKNRTYSINDLEKMLNSSEGAFDAYFVSYGKNKINATPDSFSYTELTETPKRMFSISHSEHGGFKASIRSSKEKCELGQENSKLSKELLNSMKRVKKLFNVAQNSLMVTYKGKEKIGADYQKYLKAQENFVLKMTSESISNKQSR